MTKHIPFKMLSNVQTQNPASVFLFFTSSLLCLSPPHHLSFFKGSGGSRTICSIMALTAYDINTVCFDLTVSGKWLFLRHGSINLHIQYENRTIRESHRYPCNQPVLSTAFLLCQHNFADKQLAFVIHVIHIRNILPWSAHQKSRCE